MEEKPVPANLALLNEIAQWRNRWRNASPTAWLSAIDQSARFNGADAGILERNHASFEQLKGHAVDVEAAIDLAAHVTQRGPLYDLAQRAFSEMLTVLLDSPTGRAALKDVIETVADHARSLQKAEAARRAQEAAQREAQAAARVADQVANTSVEDVLNALAARGVIVTANSAGGIDCRPSGSLSILERRVLTEKKGDVLRLLAARDAVETL
ncbi:MAG: hypothetical protein WCA22_18800 [Candidatus Binatus sp.]